MVKDKKRYENDTVPLIGKIFAFLFFFLPVKNNSGVTPAGQCGTWVKEPNGGCFTSPNYPEKYPPERECIYIIEGETQLLYRSASDLPSSFPWTILLLQPRLDSALTCSSMRNTPLSRPGSAGLTTLKSVMGPLASLKSLAATVGRRALPMSALAGGTFTSSLWPMVNWRPLAFQPGITSHKVSMSWRSLMVPQIIQKNRQFWPSFFNSLCYFCTNLLRKSPKN